MAIPLSYNVNSVRVRWASALVAILGIAGTVGVFVAMLALAQGFQTALVSSSSPRNAIVLRAGATSEMDSSVSLDEVRIVEEMPGVEHGAAGPLLSPEVVVVAAFPFRATGTDANAQIRGVSPKALEVHEGVRIREGGRFFKPGLPELVVGVNAARAYSGFDLNGTLKLGGQVWTIVGILDAHGSAFDSEAWCDATVLNQVYQRPPGFFQSATIRLTSADAFPGLKAAVAADRRLQLQVDREADYYEKESKQLTQMIRRLGLLVALVMGAGAILGALNTMYSAVAERGREIATMRAIGFGGPAVVMSFVFESLFIAFLGGVLGCVAVFPINGLTTGTMNWQTFSQLAFAFRITPTLLGMGVLFALAMGLVGGLLPALRAARTPVAVALREL